jgi:hypothetical protein
MEVPILQIYQDISDGHLWPCQILEAKDQLASPAPVQVVEAELSLIPTHNYSIFLINFEAFDPNAHLLQRVLVVQADLDVLALLVDLDGEDRLVLALVVEIEDEDTVDACCYHCLIFVVEVDEVNQSDM